MMTLGRLAGIEIRAHYSTLIVFGALTSILAYGYLPVVTPAAGPLERLAVAIIVSGLAGVSILAHELGHALVARSRGLTVTGVTLYLFGGLAHVGGAPNDPSDDIAIGLGGPAVSAVLASAFLAGGAAVMRANPQAALLLINLGAANALLFLVNALPGYPMDGGMVLRGLLWKLSGNVVAATRRATTAGKAFAYLIAAGGVWLLLRGDVIDGMWVVLIGWLLAGLAEGAYRAIIMRTALEGLTVKDLCARDVPVLQTSDSVATAAGLLRAGASSRIIAVMFGERLAGLVSDVDVARVPTADAEATSISNVMSRTGGQPTLDADCDALVLISAMPASPLRCIIVVDERGDYLGLVRHEDLTRYVEMIEALGNSSALSSRSLRRLGGVRAAADASLRSPAR
ncbi:MAG TPA: site-2 protease family protein [Candidatus Eremiobacteraceae bacterium]|nr:site-2 protease family protein [Candidatus Eremiobacteraceae bacterium]